MGIVGVKSTAGREVKFIDPSKTTKSESTWLGYTLCERWSKNLIYIFILSHTHTHAKCTKIKIYILFFFSLEHFTMKNEGWGIKEDQIPSSSH